MKLLKYLVNVFYVGIFYMNYSFETMCDGNIGDYVTGGKEDLYILSKNGNFSNFRTVIFKKYLLWK